jgi:hypothetical protein
MDYTILLDWRLMMAITTTTASVASCRLPNGMYRVTLVNPDVADILEQIGKETCKKYFGIESPVPTPKPVSYAEIANAVHEAAEIYL